jgi:hypothetical protein
MTEQQAAESFKQWQIQQTVEALKKNSEAVRAVCDIRQYLDGLDAGVDLCSQGLGKPCVTCREDARISEAIRALLPAVPETSERRAETGEEVTSDGQRLPDGRRPGLVTPDP